jgi:hypothetical protein
VVLTRIPSLLVSAYDTRLSGAGTVPLFRLLDPETGDHFYIISASERQPLGIGGG